MYRQVQRLVREGEFVHVRPSAKDRGDFRWKKTQDEAPGRNALKKGNNGCRQAALCIVIETFRPASPGLYCTPVGLTQVEVTVPLSFLSLHCPSIIEQRQLNFPLSFHAFN